MELLLTCIKSAVLYWAADFLMTVVVLNFYEFCGQIPIYCEKQLVSYKNMYHTWGISYIPMSVVM